MAWQRGRAQRHHRLVLLAAVLGQRLLGNRSAGRNMVAWLPSTTVLRHREPVPALCAAAAAAALAHFTAAAALAHYTCATAQLLGMCADVVFAAL